MPEATATHRQLLADFLSSSYRVVGKVMIPNAGLLGMMNDPTSSYVEVIDAKLARVHMPTQLVGAYDLIALFKANLFAVCLTRREDLGPYALSRGGYQTLTNYIVRITTQVYELEGTLEWSGRFDFASIMAESIRDFIPLYKATLTSILIPKLRVESPAMLFNRRHMDLLAVTQEKKPTGPIA